MITSHKKHGCNEASSHSVSFLIETHIPMWFHSSATAYHMNKTQGRSISCSSCPTRTPVPRLWVEGAEEEKWSSDVVFEMLQLILKQKLIMIFHDPHSLWHAGVFWGLGCTHPHYILMGKWDTGKVNLWCSQIHEVLLYVIHFIMDPVVGFHTLFHTSQLKYGNGISEHWNSAFQRNEIQPNMPVAHKCTISNGVIILPNSVGNLFIHFCLSICLTLSVSVSGVYVGGAYRSRRAPPGLIYWY